MHSKCRHPLVRLCAVQLVPTTLAMSTWFLAWKPPAARVPLPPHARHSTTPTPPHATQVSTALFAPVVVTRFFDSFDGSTRRGRRAEASAGASSPWLAARTTSGGFFAGTARRTAPRGARRGARTRDGAPTASIQTDGDATLSHPKCAVTWPNCQTGARAHVPDPRALHGDPRRGVPLRPSRRIAGVRVSEEERPGDAGAAHPRSSGGSRRRRRRGHPIADGTIIVVVVGSGDDRARAAVHAEPDGRLARRSSAVRHGFHPGRGGVPPGIRHRHRQGEVRQGGP